MGYYFVITSCIACRTVFSFNPYRVPSIVVRGEREALCQTCAERWNRIHPEAARPILPGAYDPIDESGDPWEAEEP